MFKPDQGIIALHGLGFGRNLGEILPTSFPELPIQLRELRNNLKSLNTNFLFPHQQTQTWIFEPGFRFPDLWSEF